MLHFDEEKLKRIFMDELKYLEQRAEHAVKTLKTLDEKMQPILDQWIKDRTLSDHAVNGVTIGMVLKDFNVIDIFVAFIYLNDFACD